MTPRPSTVLSKGGKKGNKYIQKNIQDDLSDKAGDLESNLFLCVYSSYSQNQKKKSARYLIYPHSPPSPLPLPSLSSHPSTKLLKFHTHNLPYPQTLPDTQIQHNLLTPPGNSICPNIPIQPLYLPTLSPPTIT